ncbi:sulfite exporter TauE/SafE family protein [Halpernia sp.]|uniref:sulfite exporter TauE/SafE family protein n=1 Tax=Halpernia sp. TaxID=2782209 RepID=UPI003A93BAF8
METHQIFFVIIIGIVAGVLSGLLGIGGAVLIIPALVLLLGFSQQTAQGTTLLMMVPPIGALAAWQYYKEGTVDFKVAGILAVGFLVGGYFGGKFANQIPQATLKKIFAILLLAISLKMLFLDKALK